MVEQQRQTMGQGKQSEWEKIRRGNGLCTKPTMYREGENPNLPVFLILNTWVLNHQDHHQREPGFIFPPETQRSCLCVLIGQDFKIQSPRQSTETQSSVPHPSVPGPSLWRLSQVRPVTLRLLPLRVCLFSLLLPQSTTVRQ